MKTLRTFLRHSARVGVIVPFAAFLYGLSPALAVPFLGSAQNFAVLGASTVTNTGSTTIWGDLGLYPGPSVSGFKIPPDNTVVEGPGSTGLINGPGVVSGTIYISHAAAQQAQSDALTAYNILAGLPSTADLTGQDLGTVGTLSPGVYSSSDVTALLTGTLTLDAGGNADALFVFQLAHAFTTASGSTVNVINAGGADIGVYWQVGSSATLGTSTIFAGNIIADQSISLTTTAKILCGRAIALNAAVTMDTNTISNDCNSDNGGTSRSDYGSGGFSGSGTPTPVPEPSTLALLGAGLAGLGVFRRRRKAKA